MEHFSQLAGTSRVPQFDKAGTALSARDQAEYAKKRGFCGRCGVDLFKVKYAGTVKTALNNDNVHQGICIRCEPDRVPRGVVTAWELMNKPAPTVRVAPRVNPVARLKQAASVVTTAHQMLVHARNGQAHVPAHVQAAPSTRTVNTVTDPSSLLSMSSVPNEESSGSFRVPKSASLSELPLPDQGTGERGTSYNSLPIPASPGPHTKMKARLSDSSASFQARGHTSLNLEDSELMDNDNSESSRRSVGNHNKGLFNRKHKDKLKAGTNVKDPRPDSLGLAKNPRPFGFMKQKSNSKDTKLMPSTSNHSRSRSPTPPPSPVPSPTPALEKQTKALRRQTQVAPRDDYTSGGSTKSLSELLKEMQECQNDPDALRTTLHRMRNSQGEYPPGAVKQIEPLLGQWCLQPRLLALVSGTIWRICASGDDGKQETADAGAIGELVDILRKNPNDRDLAEWIIGTLASLAYYDSTKKVIARVGGIEAILDSLKRHDKWLGNLELSCRCLYNMVVQYGDQIEKEKGGDEDTQRTIALIEEADGVAVIVKALEKNPTAPTAQRWALKLLWRLVSRSEDSTSSRVLRKMAEAGFALVANKVIRGSLTTGELFQVTVELTCLVLGNLEDDQENLESAIDCIPSATRRMRESVDDEAIQESGCRLLAILCSDDGRVVSALKDAEAFATVIRSLESHSKNTFVAEAACWALWKLSAQASLLNAPLVRRARKAMQDVVELNDEDQRIIVSVCGFTANACYVPTLKASDFPIACIVRAAELPSEDPTSYEVAESAISNLYDVFPDETSSNLAEVIKIPRMIEIIEDSSSTIRASICMWLARIATKSNKASDILSAGILEASVAVFTASRDLQLLEDSKDFPVLSNLLDLISTLLVTGDTRQVRLPSDIAQSISTMLNTDQLRADSFLVKSCSTLRNILLVSVSPLEVNGLVDCMTNAIHSSKSSTELRIEVCCVLWAMTTKNSSQNGMTLSTMLNAVVTLMEDRGDGTPYQPRLQTAAAGAAASISWCLRQDPSIIDSESVDALIANVYRALEFDHDGVETMTSILSALLNLIYLDEGTVLRSGAIVVVIDLMFEVENHAAIQEKGCTILARLAASEDLQVNLSIVQTEGIDLLVMTLATYSTNEVIQTQACKALSHLSIDPESRMLITSQGGLELIVNALNVYRGNLEVAESATLALLNLSADGEGELLISSGVVEAVVQAMKKYRNNSKLQENGMGVLQNVSMKAARAKEVIAESEGIDAIVSAVREFLAEPAVLERAFTALWSLAVLDSNQVRIANANGIAMVINGMLSSIDNDSVQKQGCGCLCTLASNVSNKVLIRSTGGVDAIMYGMWAHYSSESLQTEACRALSSLAVDMVASENEIKAILTAMRSFPDSEDLQEHACFAIRNYLLSPDNSLIRSKAAEVRTAVYGALTTCPDSCSTLADEVLAMLD